MTSDPAGGPDPDAVTAALRGYAAAAAQEPDLLSTPVRECELISYAPDIEVLSHWALFNPMGPTVKAVFTASVPDENQLLLGHCMLNPFHSEHVVCGVFDTAGEESTETIRDGIKAFFNRNGSPQVPFLQGMPTLIWPSSQGLFSLPECATLVHRSLSSLPPEDLEATTSRLQSMRGKPWERNPPQTVFGLDPDSQPEQFDGPWPPPWDIFQNWYLTVTNVEHCKAEAPHIGSAWNGAITFQSTMRNQEMADNAMPWTVAQQFMRRMLTHAIGSSSQGGPTPAG